MGFSVGQVFGGVLQALTAGNPIVAGIQAGFGLLSSLFQGVKVAQPAARQDAQQQDAKTDATLEAATADRAAAARLLQMNPRDPIAKARLAQAELRLETARINELVKQLNAGETTVKPMSPEEKAKFIAAAAEGKQRVDAANDAMAELQKAMAEAQQAQRVGAK